MSGEPAYLDASAAVKLLVAEPETPVLRRDLARRGLLVSSELLEIELACTARRRGGGLLARVAPLLRRIDLVPVIPTMRHQAAGPWQPPQRTLDALHLATALALDLEELVLVTYDVVQAQAGAAAGLAVTSPT